MQRKLPWLGERHAQTEELLRAIAALTVGKVISQTPQHTQIQFPSTVRAVSWALQHEVTEWSRLRDFTASLDEPVVLIVTHPEPLAEDAS